MKLHVLKRVAVKALAIDWFGWIPARVQLAIVERAGLCDWSWYAATQLREPSATVHAARRHFLVHGLAEGRSPSPLFDGAWYRARFGLDATVLGALLQYIAVGDRIGISPCMWFDPNYARATGGGSRASLRPTAGQYLRNYKRAGLPHPLFDQEWYLSQYPDVQQAGVAPLVHFLFFGIPEGRLPNPYFSPLWYLETYPDVAMVTADPYTHFVRFGAREGRSPGPEFNAQQYLDAYPDAAASGMDALAHYLAVGRQDGRQLGKRPLALSDLEAPAGALPETNRRMPGVVDIVLPVYRGLEETRNCIESVLQATNLTPTRLHIYNDCSPEPEVTQYLRTLAAANAAVRLEENAQNLGFVRTVNAGMAHAMVQNDSIGALLLNSDTIVSGDWVDRLVRHLRNGRVGSVTALSNNATICSWPLLGANTLPGGMSSADVDAIAAKVNAGVSVEVPTGVGFCMLISRESLSTVGLFDAEAFGKGYGEENDFCMRAAAAGFRNLLAMDVFVEHVGEVSFADDSKPGKIIAQKIIDERYPDYNRRVARFCSMDPGFSARVRLVLGVWKARRRPVTVIFTHCWGGGTERAVQETRRSLARVGEVVIIRPAQEHGLGGEVKVSHESTFDSFEFFYRYRSPADLADLLALLGATQLQIHHLVGFGESMRRAVALSKLPFSFHVHDNYTICPQIMLTDAEGNYCGEPSPAGCDACIAQRPSHGATDIRNWRTYHAWAALGAARVLAPSRDAAQRLQRYTGVAVETAYHEEALSAAEVTPTFGAGLPPYKILLLGVLANHKGLHKLVAMAEEARRVSAPLQFHLLGYPVTDDEGKLPFTWSGAYEEDVLDTMIAEHDADAFLFISQAPETYSYTLSHAIRTGRPIMANRLGAFVERLENYPNALMLPHDAAAQVLVAEMSAWLEGIYRGNRP